MGSPRFRRVDTAEHLPKRFALFFLTLALIAAAPVAADEIPDDPAAAQEPAPQAEPPAPNAPTHSVGAVTVTATRAERDVLDVPGNVTVIDREAIDRSGARDLPNLLRRQSGIFVTNTTTSPAGTRVEARGFNNGGALGSSILVQVDGRRVNEADTGDTDWALLDLDRVERIEIIRGPASAIYGDNAIGGVINIITRPHGRADGPWSATLRGAGGSFTTGEGSLRLNGAQGPVTGSLLVQGLTTDGYRDRSEFWRVNANGSIEMTIGDRVLLGLGGGWHEDDRSLPGSLSRAEIEDLGRRAANPFTVADAAAVESWFLRSWLEVDLAPDVLLRLQPYGRRRTDDVTLSFRNFDPPPDTTTTTIDLDKDSVGVDVHVRVDRSIGEFPNRLIVGTEFLRDHTDRNFFDGSGTTTDDNRRRVFAGYLQNEFHILHNLFLATGVRFDYADYRLERTAPGIPGEKVMRPDYDVWSPKASLTWRPLTPLSLYFSYARGFRLPNFDEDAPLLGAVPDLEPQVSDSYEVGAKFQNQRASASLALYRMDVENEITFDPFILEPGEIFPGGNANFDEVLHQGIEVSLDAMAFDWLQVYGSYTYDDVEIQEHSPTPAFEGSRMPMIPRHRGTVGARTLLPLGFELAGNANFVGGRYLSNDFTNSNEQLDAYTTLDLFVTWRPSFGEHWEGFVTFAVRNVTDEHYADFGADFGGPGFPFLVFYPAALRTYDARFMVTYRP